MAENHIFKIRLSLKGRPLKSYSFTKPQITVGRDPSSDIVLDNPSISRHHLRFVLSPSGYYSVEDLGSGNGTLLNDEAVKKDYVYNNDVVQVSKYSMWITFEEDRRGSEQSASDMPNPAAAEGTMILSQNDLKKMMSSARDAESPDTAPSMERPQDSREPSRVTSAVITVTVIVAFILGTAVGAGATWLLVK